MKRILSLFLAIVAVVGVGFVLPVTAEENSLTSTEVCSVTEIVSEVFTTETTTEPTTETTTEPTTQPVVALAGAPTLKSLSNANGGLVLKWTAAKNAKSYRVYRCAKGEKGWTFIGKTTGYSYADKNVKSGVTYKYTVRSVNEAGHGGYDKKGITIVRLSSPDNIKYANGKDSVKVTWASVKGATGYRVYRQNPGQTNWTYIKTVKPCQYIDKNVTNGSQYRYTVKATYSIFYSGHYSDGKFLKYIATPVTQNAVTYPDKLVFNWGSIKGVSFYRVYRRGVGEGWTRLADVKGTTYTDKTVKKGQKYRYTVKAFSGSFTSGYDSEGVLLKYMGVNGQNVYGKNAKYQRPGTINNPTVIKIDEDKWNLTVVNSGYRIPSDYEPDLVYVCGSGERLDRDVAVQYEKMYKAAAKEGVYLTPCSGYRSYSLQERNYNRKVQYYKNQGYTTAQAKVKAATIIMPPGSSEHNLGYAMDIVCVDEWFEDTKEFKWLQKNAANYGFIMRYPKDKQHITKVTYEPWHWRYVGVDAAKAMKSSGLTLEEYMGVKQ